MPRYNTLWINVLPDDSAAIFAETPGTQPANTKLCRGMPTGTQRPAFPQHSLGLTGLNRLALGPISFRPAFIPTWGVEGQVLQLTPHSGQFSA